MRSAKSQTRSPSVVLSNCPRTLLSPLTLTSVGLHQFVIVVIRSPQDCLLKAIQSLCQSSLIKASGAPRNCAALILHALAESLSLLGQHVLRHGSQGELRAHSKCTARRVFASILDMRNRIVELFYFVTNATARNIRQCVSFAQHSNSWVGL